MKTITKWEHYLSFSPNNLIMAAQVSAEEMNVPIEVAMTAWVASIEAMDRENITQALSDLSFDLE